MLMGSLTAYSGRDLQNCRSLLVDAVRSGLSAAELDEMIEQEIARRQDAPSKQRDRCPSCGRGVVVISRQQGVAYKICTVRGRAGCGWSEVI